MITRLLLSLAGGAALLGFALWAMRPRKRVKPGIHNNWQQRDGTEQFSAPSTVDREETGLGGYPDLGGGI